MLPELSIAPLSTSLCPLCCLLGKEVFIPFYMLIFLACMSATHLFLISIKDFGLNTLFLSNRYRIFSVTLSAFFLLKMLADLFSDACKGRNSQ